MPYYNRDPKRDQTFDNHPCTFPQTLNPINPKLILGNPRPRSFGLWFSHVLFVGGYAVFAVLDQKLYLEVHWTELSGLGLRI